MKNTISSFVDTLYEDSYRVIISHNAFYKHQKTKERNRKRYIIMKQHKEEKNRSN